MQSLPMFFPIKLPIIAIEVMNIDELLDPIREAIAVISHTLPFANNTHIQPTLQKLRTCIISPKIIVLYFQIESLI